MRFLGLLNDYAISPRSATPRFPQCCNTGETPPVTIGGAKVDWLTFTWALIAAKADEFAPGDYDLQFIHSILSLLRQHGRLHVQRQALATSVLKGHGFIACSMMENAIR